MHSVFTSIIQIVQVQMWDVTSNKHFTTVQKFRIKYYLYARYTEGQMEGDKVFHLFISYVFPLFVFTFRIYPFV
jgi:hypothetical protein